MMPKETIVMVEVTDMHGHVESEPRKVESWDGGRVVRIVSDDGTAEVWDGAELVAAALGDREIRAA